jgi:uncharacterized protein
MNRVKGISGFEWDQGNCSKNPEKHNVSNSESEELFFNQPLIVADDKKHSKSEKRLYALGRTNESRKLFVVFTFRTERIRVISSRDMNKKEQAIYERAEKISSGIQD